MNLTQHFQLVYLLTKEDVKQGQEAEGDGDRQLRINGKTQDDGHRATEEQRQEDHEPGELEQRLDLLACKGLHLI